MKFQTTVIKEMKQRIAAEYERKGTAQALRECYEKHIKNYTGRHDPHRLAAWGRRNLELYKQLTKDDKPNFEPYDKQSMKPINVYKELDKIKEYELQQLIKKLSEKGGEYTYDEYSQPYIIVYNGCSGGARMEYIAKVALTTDGGVEVVTDGGDVYTSWSIVTGEMTDLLNLID